MIYTDAGLWQRVMGYAFNRKKQSMYIVRIDMGVARGREEGEGKYDGKDRQECYIEIRSVL